MSPADAILIGLLALDLIVGAAVGCVVAFEYRRQRRLALAAGQHVPPSATGQFVFLGMVWGASFALIYGAIAAIVELWSGAESW